MAEWYLNGKPADALAPDSRGFQYGDGLFETVAVRGGEPRLWQFHLDRLRRGCKRLRLKAPDADALRSMLSMAISGEASATVKLLAVAGETGRGYGRHAGKLPDVLIGVFPHEPVDRHHYRNGVDATLCETRLAVGSALAGLKTLNRLEQVLARSEVLEKGCFEGFTRDADDRIICGTMSNVFAVRDNLIVTPPVESCGVQGVMRRLVIETMAQTSRPITIDHIGDLHRYTELFVTNSQFGLLPIRSCDAWQRGAGPVTHDVMQGLAHAGIEECRL